MSDDEVLEQLLEVTHAARRLRVSQETVRRLIRAGKLPAIRFESGHFRIARADLEAFIESRRVRREPPDRNNPHTPAS